MGNEKDLVFLTLGIAAVRVPASRFPTVPLGTTPAQVAAPLA